MKNTRRTLLSDLRPQVLADHPLRAYVALPRHWSPERSWPILVAVDGANGGHFLWHFLRARHARGAKPFFLICPLIVSNRGRPDARNYRRDPAVWARIGREGAVAFDAAGILALVDAVREAYSGEPRCYLGAWSAGGHVGWQLILTHPERLAGAVLVAANYAGRERCPAQPARGPVELPVYGLQGGRDRHLAALNDQWERATLLGRQRGYTAITRTMLPNARHAPMLAEMFAILGALRDDEP